MFSRDFPEESAASLRKIVAGVSSLYRQLSPAFVEPRVFAAVHTAPVNTRSGFHGDVTPDQAIVRLSFFSQSENVPVQITGRTLCRARIRSRYSTKNRQER